VTSQHTLATHEPLDFYCYDYKLCIELDGGQPYHDTGRHYDENRDDSLKSRGIHVLRFSNVNVLVNLEAVLQKVLEEMTLLTLSFSQDERDK
jgi:very-short-patch-repair endonuclease